MELIQPPFQQQVKQNLFVTLNKEQQQPLDENDAVQREDKINISIVEGDKAWRLRAKNIAS